MKKFNKYLKNYKNSYIFDYFLLILLMGDNTFLNREVHIMNTNWISLAHKILDQ